MRVPCRAILASLWLSVAVASLHAEVPSSPAVAAAAEESADPAQVVTQHEGRFGGVDVRYVATAGLTPIFDDDGKPEAKIFSVAYTAKVKDPGRRPVTFLFNGGPGSASFWIQMGALGPRIIALDGPAGRGDLSSPGAALVDNPDALLDISDLVFIDPVGTGYSHAVGAKKNDDFYKISTDGSSVAKFIRTWLTENKRWQSPRFVGGESYGTIRTAMIVDDDAFMTFNGAILISQGLDWGTVMMPPGYDRGYELFLPSYSAAAWFYHRFGGQHAGSVADAVAESEAFASRDYTAALSQGSHLDAAERDRVAARLAKLTGIPEDEWVRSNLRIAPDTFRRLLLRDQGVRIARFDARYTTGSASVFDPQETFDPSLSAAGLPYLNAMRGYLGTELQVKATRPYVGVLPGDWTYDLDNGAFVNPAPKIGAAMTRNPGMHLFVASGYYDFSSPVSSAQYNIGHAGIPTDRVDMKYYPTGHMMYLEPEYRQHLLSDMRSFIVTTMSDKSGK